MLILLLCHPKPTLFGAFGRVSACHRLLSDFGILLLRGKPSMSDDVKPMRPIKLSKEEISEELVNDSLGEETPADSTGLDSKEEARKREHPS